MFLPQENILMIMNVWNACPKFPIYHNFNCWWLFISAHIYKTLEWFLEIYRCYFCFSSWMMLWRSRTQILPKSCVCPRSSFTAPVSQLKREPYWYSLGKESGTDIIRIFFLLLFILLKPCAYHLIIPPANKVWGLYSDPYVRPFDRSFVRPSQSLIRYSSKTAEQNSMNLSGIVHYIMPYCTSYFKFLSAWFCGFPEQNKDFASTTNGEGGPISNPLLL